MGKIKKDISKLTKVPHPQSRKTAQLTKKIIKQDHRKKTKQDHLMRTNIQAEKFLWFKEELENNDVCAPEILLRVVEKYLSRFDEELEMINLKHGIGGRRNRQHASREDVIKMTKKNEDEEFNTCGIELPDVFNPKQFKIFKEWSGELRFLQNFRLARFNRAKLEKKDNTNEVNKATALSDKIDEDKSKKNTGESVREANTKMECT